MAATAAAVQFSGCLSGAACRAPSLRRVPTGRGAGASGAVALRRRRPISLSVSAACDGAARVPNSGAGARFSGAFFRVLEAAGERIQRAGGAALDAVRRPQTAEEAQLVTALKGRMACAAAPVLLAAVSQAGVNTPLTVVASGMAKWLELYSGVLMVRVLLSWFPNIPWERQPLQAMRDMCDPYLNLFRNIIPPLFNALDLSPMLAFLVLGVLTSILNTTVQAT